MMKIVLVGGGGHCASCLDVISSAGYDVAGVLDSQRAVVPIGTTWLGDDSWADSADAVRMHFLIAVGQTQLTNTRRKLFETLNVRGYSFATIVSPSAVLARTATLGRATIVMHRAVVNAGARVGDNCIVNTAAIVEHDAIVGNHCHISTGAIINGAARIGSGSMIGSGAIVLQGVSIASEVMVGSGAVVTSDITSPGVWVGVPARRQS